MPWTERHLSITLLFGAAAMTGACGEPADLAGIYESECDASATIELLGDGEAIVNRNNCEGYSEESWDYEADRKELVMARQGQLDNPDQVKERFDIEGDELVLTSSSSFIACGNCMAGDKWVKQ